MNFYGDHVSWVEMPWLRWAVLGSRAYLRAVLITVAAYLIVIGLVFGVAVVLIWSIHRPAWWAHATISDVLLFPAGLLGMCLFLAVLPRAISLRDDTLRIAIGKAEDYLALASYRIVSVGRVRGALRIELEHLPHPNIRYRDRQVIAAPIIYADRVRAILQKSCGAEPRRAV